VVKELTGSHLRQASSHQYTSRTFPVQAKSFKCDVRHAKRSFHRTANEIFGKIDRFASEEITL